MTSTSSSLSAFLLVVLILLESGCSSGQKSGFLLPPNASTSLTSFSEDEGEFLLPTVLIATLVRNKAHTLPYFLSCLENLDYPKDRISIWMKSDHNEDNTTLILRRWGQELQDSGSYHSVNIDIVDSPPARHPDESSPFQWSSRRFQHIIRLKEEALSVGRKVLWADFLWFLDADVFILNNLTLRHLVEKKKAVVAPMLLSGSLYSNFWGLMREDYYYARSEDYKDILEWKKVGCFPVPLVHSAILIDLRRRSVPGFTVANSSVPEDDLIRFAVSAREKGITTEICNDLEFGYVLSPLENENEAELSLDADLDRLQNLRVEVSAYWPDGLSVNEELTQFLPPPITLSSVGFDQVFVINLKRRPDRLRKMDNAMNVLGIDYSLVEGVDGKELNDAAVLALGIKQLPAYRDPFSKRVMTFGEIGCFLSHHKIWERMVKYHVNSALILEDDVKFEPYFVLQLQRVFEEGAKLLLNWDLIYLGRKRSPDAKEPFVEGSQYLVHPDYTYWTLGYALTLRGAKKLLAARPLEKLVPVDEYLPIMFDRHNNASWKSAFEPRNLVAFSAEPLLVYPTHYTSEPGYISDTEKSLAVPPVVVNDDGTTTTGSCQTSTSNDCKSSTTNTNNTSPVTEKVEL